MNHTGDSQQNETDANYFASNILAPRIAIHYSECKNANDVSHIFSMSYSAAEIAFDDYRRWRRYVAYHKTVSYTHLDVYKRQILIYRIFTIYYFSPNIITSFVKAESCIVIFYFHNLTRTFALRYPQIYDS